MTGSDTRTSSTSVGENIPALNQAAIAAFGVPTLLTNIISSVMGARLAHTRKRLSSSSGSASIGLAAFVLPFTLHGNVTSNMLPDTLSLA